MGQAIYTRAWINSPFSKDKEFKTPLSRSWLR
jgi:hypothetical protein